MFTGTNVSNMFNERVCADVNAVLAKTEVTLCNIY